MKWHPEQHDEWPVPNEVLVRTVPYHSCREMTRHLMPFSDGVVDIAPAELKAECATHFARSRAAFERTKKRGAGPRPTPR